MTNYRKIKNMHIKELSKFLDDICRFEKAPWNTWFDDMYCKNCESIKCKYESELAGGEYREIDCAYCELETKCKYFPHLDRAPSSEEVCEMWLREKYK